MTNLLQSREKEIFEALKKLEHFDFVLIGGYAVNTYTLPRFSVDCDIVVKEENELIKIAKTLEGLGYEKAIEENTKTGFGGSFIRYEKRIEKGFKVSFDILYKEVADRKKISITADWIFENSAKRMLKGKTFLESVKLRIPDPDALFIMKFISCRNVDIRDIFMLVSHVRNFKRIIKEVESKVNFKENFEKIKIKITSQAFRNDLQGVYGYVDDKLFEKYKKLILEMEEIGISHL